MNLYGIVGAGGFGREVIPIAREMLLNNQGGQDFKIVFVDDDPKSTLVNQYQVMSRDEFLSYPADKKYFNVSISSYSDRRKIVEEMIVSGVEPFGITAANHIALENNAVGEGAILLSFSMITSNVIIGKYFHANIYSYIAHDCVIGDYVTFAPNVHCNGNVIIEDNVYIGTGVNIKQGKPNNPIRIGKGAIIGMGAVVTKDIPPYETVIGNPAKPYHRKEELV